MNSRESPESPKDKSSERIVFHFEKKAEEARERLQNMPKAMALGRQLREVGFEMGMPAVPGGPPAEMRVSFGDAATRDAFLKIFLEVARKLADKEGLDTENIDSKFNTKAGDDRAIYIQPVQLMGETGVFISEKGEPSINFNSGKIRDVFLEMTGLRDNRCKTRHPNWEKQRAQVYESNTYAPRGEEGNSVVYFNPHLLGPGQRFSDQEVNMDAGKDILEKPEFRKP